MSGCGCGMQATTQEELKVLRLLLVINAVMFLVEVVAGYIADSTGLVADSLDMLADAGVYGLSLYAIGRSIALKTRAAEISGVLQIALGLGVLFEVGRRFFFGSEPESDLMVIIGGVALVANIGCMMLLAKHRKGEVHMRASWIFSTNDVIANLGVIISGFLVALTASRLPDLAIGFVIAALVIRGGITILREARETGTGSSCSARASE